MVHECVLIVDLLFFPNTFAVLNPSFLDFRAMKEVTLSVDSGATLVRTAISYSKLRVQFGAISVTA